MLLITLSHFALSCDTDFVSRLARQQLNIMHTSYNTTSSNDKHIVTIAQYSIHAHNSVEIVIGVIYRTRDLLKLGT